MKHYIGPIGLSFLLGLLAAVGSLQGKGDQEAAGSRILTPAELIAGISWGDAAEALKLGARHMAKGTNANLDVAFFLLDVGQTNRGPRLWIAPPGFRRTEAQLIDRDGNVVPPRAGYRTRENKTFKSLADVPKNQRGIRKGALWPDTIYPYPYDTLNLTNAFHIERGGDYTLVASGQVLKRHPNMGLTLLRLPPVTLRLHLREECVRPATKPRSN